MKIAVVAPSPVPFKIGGMENLAWGLCDAINQYTDHQAELIKLPSRENNFWDLIETYYSYYKVDLSYYDCVISTKYPSWMVKHQNSICYMVHTLRGLYDTYHLMNQPFEVDASNPYIKNILCYMEQNTLAKDLDEFFEIVFALREPNKNIPDKYFEFPGPFIRKIIHFMDQWALSSKNVTNIYAISNTIKNRTEYFPPSVPVTVIYPPAVLKKISFGDYKYIFIISRLDSPKRIDMLIQAMKWVKSDIKLFIAGTGPEEKKLKKLAAKDHRINFLGFINDEEVDIYYSNCLFVPYFPYDEDYGYITLEAMLHKKAVLTTNDAGGPGEFVLNGKNGFITRFSEKEIAEKIDYLAQNPAIAQKMGENAFESVKSITWEKVTEELFKLPVNKNIFQYTGEKIKLQKRKKITVTSTFPIYPPLGGGQARIFNLYKNIAEEYDVEIVSFTNTDQKEFIGEISPGLKETRIPKSQKHQDEEWNIEKNVGVPISDIGMITLSGLSPRYGACLKTAINESDFVIISHPYLYEEAKKFLNGRKFIYEAHNVESVMKKNMLPNSRSSKELVNQVFDTEKECCERSEFIMTCSDEDCHTLEEIYHISRKKMIIVPNGVDTQSTAFTNVRDRLANKQSLGLNSEKIGLFMGSWHGPNLEACEKILEIASECPDCKFLLMGSQCGYFEKRKLPSNVGLLGIVDEKTKKRIFSTVDFALNPMMSGSGTNLKMFDYLSAGIPVVTTSFGTRGIDNKKVFIVSTIDEMSEYIKHFDILNYELMVLEGREYVEKFFDWGVISGLLLKKLHSI
ncbi:glycosyltransferase family 4 protein [Hungatella hathewayi]